MARNIRPIFLICALAIGLQLQSPTVAFAQSQQGQANRDQTNYNNQTKKKGKEHTLSFEDELVEGANAKPELFYLFQKKKFNYKRLIKLRENFLPEMRKTSEEIQRSRSQN